MWRKYHFHVQDISVHPQHAHFLYVLATTAHDMNVQKEKYRLFTPNSFNIIGFTQEALSSPLPIEAPCLGVSFHDHTLPITASLCALFQQHWRDY